jgi:hypothetical protein
MPGYHSWAAGKAIAVEWYMCSAAAAAVVVVVAAALRAVD